MCDLERGKKNVTSNNITLLTLLLDVNDVWLKTGVGDIFNKKNINNSIIDMFSDILSENDDSFKKQFLFSLTQFNEEQWKLLQSMFEIIYKNNNR